MTSLYIDLLLPVFFIALGALSFWDYGIRGTLQAIIIYLITVGLLVAALWSIPLFFTLPLEF